MNLSDWWRHLDPAVAGGIVGAVIGGIFAVIAGIGGAWLVGRLDSNREERQQVREHRASVLAVLYELTTILFGIATILGGQAYRPIDTPDWAYHSVFMVLIARLPEATAQRLGYAYSQLSMLRSLLSEGAKGSSIDFEAIRNVEGVLEGAHEELRLYAEQSLGLTGIRIAAEARAASRQAMGPSK